MSSFSYFCVHNSLLHAKAIEYINNSYLMKKRNVWKKATMIRLAKKSFRRKLKSKKKKRERNRSLIGLNTEKRAEKKQKKILENLFRDYQHIKAPSIFSLTRNTEETLKFISNIESCFKKKKKVFINLKQVTDIANGAIVVLLSILVKFKTNKIDFNGNYPKNNNAENILVKSGFFKYLYQREIEMQDAYSFEHKICTHANKKVDSKLSEEIIQKASKFIWGEERRCTGIQRVFLELMQNTNNHASTKGQGEQHWWATVHHSSKEKKVSFSFIDFGVGIFESLANKKSGNKFFDAINKVKNSFNFETNSELLKLLLNGDVHRTVTGKYYRGKGLPGIFEACKNNKISNLIVISNDAMADYTNNSYITLNNKLSGTFVYWELNENNINIKD